MRAKTLGVAALLLLASAVTGHTMQEASGSLLPQATGVTPAKSLAPQIAGLAPQFTLLTSSGKTWDSRQQLGQRAILLLLVGESPVVSGKDSTPESLLVAIAETAVQPRATGVETIVVSKAAGITLSGINRQFDSLNLRDENGELHNLFRPDPTALTLIAIDRAGFLRRMEMIRESKDSAALMLQTADPTPKLEVGKPAPDFITLDMNGRARRLSELRGHKNLLLTFFPRCFTGGCANHLTSLRDARDDLEREQTETWAVSVDTADGARGQIAFSSRLGLNFPLLPDTGRNISILYGATRTAEENSIRMSVLIDKNGVMRVIDKAVNVMAHGPDMLRWVRKLNGAK